MSENQSSATPEVVAQLAAFYFRNGYVRVRDPERRKGPLARSYKKGYEVRLVAYSKAELTLLRRLLRAAGFELGNPHARDASYRQPVYGKEQVECFLKLVGPAPANSPRGLRRRRRAERAASPSMKRKKQA